MRHRARITLFTKFRMIAVEGAAGAAAALTLLSPQPSLAQEASTGAKTARVAVFDEPGFPSYLADDKATLPTPDAIVARLESLGISAEVVHADALADSSRFNAGRYSLLILPYGNCYPQVALQNLQTFHRENGGFVLTGIPFTHPVVLDPGVADGWWAVPGWGDLVRIVPGGGQHGENAFLFHGRPDDWVGTNSPRFPVHAGQALRLSAWFKDQGQKPVDESHLYLQFLDKDGYLINQTGFVLPFARTGKFFRIRSSRRTAPRLPMFRPKSRMTLIANF